MRKTAKDLSQGKLQVCSIIREGCGFCSNGECHKPSKPFTIKDKEMLSNGERRLKCPVVVRRTAIEQPEQFDWIGR